MLFFIRLKEIFEKTKENDDVKKVLTANLSKEIYLFIIKIQLSKFNFIIAFGGALIEHCLSLGKFADKNIIGKNFSFEKQSKQLFECLKEGENIFKQIEEKNTQVYLFDNFKHVLNGYSFLFNQRAISSKKRLKHQNSMLVI